MTQKWYKKFGSVIAAYLLGVAILMTSSYAVFYFVLANPDRVKSVLVNSGVYESFTPTIVEEMAAEQREKGRDVQTIPLNNPAIKQAAIDAFGPQDLKANTENLVDGTYAWLNGKTQEPRFVLDFTKNKNMLAKNIGNYAEKRASKLPDCNLYNIPAEINIFDLECLPPRVSPAQIEASVASDLRQDKNLLPKTKITPQNIIAQNDQNPFKNSSLPTQFKISKLFFWGLILITAGLSVATVLLGQSRGSGINRASRSFLAAGIFISLVPLAMNFFFDQLTKSNIFTGASINNLLIPLGREFVSAVSNVYFIFGAVSILIGVAGFIYSNKFLKDNSNPKQNS